MSENVVIKKDRTVTVPASEAKIGVQYDHNVNVITFDCPRYPDDDRNVDMSTMQIYINYMLPDKTLGSYLAENVKVDTNNPDTIHFDWKITRNVTQVKGALQALVCIKKVDAEGNELYHWNTDLIQSFRVGEGMECLETISSDYADVISQLLVNMNTVTGEFEALSADVTARTSEETLQGLVNNAASDEKLRTIVDTYMEEHPVGINVDDTLTVSGDAADAKITGDRISELKSDLANLEDVVYDIKEIVKQTHFDYAITPSTSEIILVSGYKMYSFSMKKDCIYNILAENNTRFRFMVSNSPFSVGLVGEDLYYNDSANKHIYNNKNGYLYGYIYGVDTNSPNASFTVYEYSVDVLHSKDYETINSKIDERTIVDTITETITPTVNDGWEINADLSISSTIDTSYRVRSFTLEENATYRINASENIRFRLTVANETIVDGLQALDGVKADGETEIIYKNTNDYKYGYIYYKITTGTPFYLNISKETYTTIKEKLNSIVSKNYVYPLTGDAIQSAINNGGIVELQPNAEYICNKTITWYFDKAQVNGNGATLNFSSLPNDNSNNDIAIVVMESEKHDFPFPNLVTRTFNGCIIKKDITRKFDETRYGTGVSFDSNDINTPLYSSFAKFVDCSIYGFYKAVNIGSEAWLITFDHCDICYSKYGVVAPTGTTNSGEKISLINCAIGGCEVAIYVKELAHTVMLVNCSLDYNYCVFCVTLGGQIIASNCHIETTKDRDYVFKAIGDGTILVSDSVIYLQSATYGLVGIPSEYSDAKCKFVLRDNFKQIYNAPEYSLNEFSTITETWIN